MIRQKLARPAVQEQAITRAWRLAVPRAMMEAAGLDVGIHAVAATARPPADLPDHALFLTLTHPDGAKGAVVLDPALVAALVSMQMTGRVGDMVPRRPTRVDATLCRNAIDIALATAGEAAAGFRVDQFLTGADALDLFLPAGDLTVLRTDVSLNGQQPGLFLILPPALATEGEGEGFGTGLADQVMASEAVLNAVLCRMTVPLEAILHLQVGTTVPLPRASLEGVGFETVSGQRVAEGRLGQNRGLRAIRLSGEGAEIVPLRRAS